MLSPATSALGGWRLVAMTTKASGDITVTAAHCFGGCARKLATRQDQTRDAIFARSLPIVEHVQDGTSTEAEEAEHRSLIAMAVNLPAAEWLIADLGYRVCKCHRFERPGEGRLVLRSVER